MLRYVGADQNIDGGDLDVSLASKDALRSFGRNLYMSFNHKVQHIPKVSILLSDNIMNHETIFSHVVKVRDMPQLGVQIKSFLRVVAHWPKGQQLYVV